MGDGSRGSRGSSKFPMFLDFESVCLLRSSTVLHAADGIWALDPAGPEKAAKPTRYENGVARQPRAKLQYNLEFSRRRFCAVLRFLRCAG